MISAEELEQIEININSMSVTDEDIEEYFNSEEYKEKTKNVIGLGSGK